MISFVIQLFNELIKEISSAGNHFPT